MNNSHQPTAISDRVHEIDGIRGFALLGILLMNIMSFATPMMQDAMEMRQTERFTGQYNEWTIFFINTFVTANFYTMFSFLFGLGFYIFLSRAQRKVQSTNVLFLRRMGMLLIFGILHGVFLWYGDILWTYAVTGILLLIFYKFRAKVNLIISIVILSVFTVFLLMAAIPMFMMEIPMEGTFSLGFDMTGTIHNNDYIGLLGINAAFLGLNLMNVVFLVPIVLAVFLLGLYAGQKGIFNDLDRHRRLIKRVAGIGIGVGLPVKALTGYAMTYETLNGGWNMLSLLANTLGGPLMSLGYIALFLIIARRVPVLVKILQPVGQMALTNYIMQTVIMMVIFYGFNLFNRVDAVYFIPIVLGVFIIQVIYSLMWMKVFRFGPLEWLWRMVTYWKVMPISRR
ncbi:DUF418 domain-containing protein [Lacicoccus alkaliphilus]|uniref:DUF418 domain-containing protein n=1 Tax=Lacicoccus alkaliphilus DSM 16010 TaxID=1123231 RepID=A0A1M7AK02_9BACL|nr:DUF418 domain-containing protein [Salinicoccus alkaliphilus]SHL42826.1 uncharacterized protein SAMN02745189_00174 [Salinicoccus alkaliphilus DSM 16010]